MASRTAAAILTTANATAQALTLQINAQRDSLLQIQQALSLDGPGLLNYLAIDELSSADDVNLAVEGPALFGGQ